MKKRILLYLLLTCFLVGCSNQSAENNTNANNDSSSTNIEYEKKYPIDIEYEISSELSDDIRSFQVQIYDQVYTFPVSYEDFVASGWEVDTTYQSADGEIEAGFDKLVWFKKGDIRVDCFVYNPDNSIQNYEGCVIAGIVSCEVEGAIENVPASIYLPGGFQIGVATREEVEALYGTPDSLYEGDSLIIYTYEIEDSWDSVNVDFDVNGVLYDYETKHYEATEDYVYSEADTSYIPNYTAPIEMTDNVSDLVIQFDGDLYCLPVPVSALVEKGWESEQLNDLITAGSFGNITLKRDGKEFDTFIYNITENAITVENTYIKELSTASLYKEPFEISGGISKDTTEEQLIDILIEQKIPYETEINSLGKRYVIDTDGDSACDIRIMYEDGIMSYMYVYANID